MDIIATDWKDVTLAEYRPRGKYVSGTGVGRQDRIVGRAYPAGHIHLLAGSRDHWLKMEIFAREIIRVKGTLG